MPEKITAEEILYLRWVHKQLQKELEEIELADLQDRYEHETDKKVPSQYDILTAAK